MTSYKIQLLGSSFTIQADQDPQYLKRIIDFIKTKIQKIEKNASGKDPLRIAILTSMVIADELFQERNSHLASENKQSESEEAERITRLIIEKIDNSLI